MTFTSLNSMSVNLLDSKANLTRRYSLPGLKNAVNSLRGTKTAGFVGNNRRSAFFCPMLVRERALKVETCPTEEGVPAGRTGNMAAAVHTELSNDERFL
jgi:hypothetical protein